MDEEMDYRPIMLLPNEVLSVILSNITKFRDIMSFGLTCKQFYEFVTANQYIWKKKFRDIAPLKISNIVEKYGDGNWFEETKRLFSVKKEVYKELATMSPKYYWRTNEVTMQEVNNFFDIALRHSHNYHHVVFALQDVIQKGTKCADRQPCENKFNLTDVYYAKVVVRFLIQTFLTLKWLRLMRKGALPPEMVLNFFVQWTDPVAMHSDEEVKACIGSLAVKVENMFRKEDENAAADNVTLRDKIAKGMLTEKQVLEAVSEVVYRQNHIRSILPGSNIEGLDIVEVLKTGCGNIIVAAVIYQAVARKCGVHCELIAFPNHLFLEWRSATEFPQQVYKVDLENGRLVLQGRCPFAPSTFREEYLYNPDGFLQYIISAYLMTMGAIKNWRTLNSVYILDFLSNNMNDDNPYKDFLPYLEVMMNEEREPELKRPLEIENLVPAYMQIISTLITLNKEPVCFTREMEVKQRHQNVKFAVGMLVYHQRFDYLCVIRGWDLKFTSDWRLPADIGELEHGPHQPFYNVISVDQSDRYVAQEHLLFVDRPTRLYHLEDVIAKEFSHFDGFSYIPNAEKAREYPGDDVIRDFYRNRAAQRVVEAREGL